MVMINMGLAFGCRKLGVANASIKWVWPSAVGNWGR